MLSVFVVMGLAVAFFAIRKRRRRTVARRDLLSTTFEDRTSGFPRDKVAGRGGL